MATYNKKDFDNLESGETYTVTATTNEGYGVEDVKENVTASSTVPTSSEPTGGTSIFYTGGTTPSGALNTDIKTGTITFTATANTPERKYYIKAKQIRFKVLAAITSGQDTYGSVSVSGVDSNSSVPYNNTTPATVTATPKDPCTFAGWTKSGGGSTDTITPSSSTALTKSLSTLKVNDVTMTASFNCVASVVDYNGNVVKGGTTTWVEDNTIHVPNDRCCTLYKYPVTNTDLNNGKSGCNKNYFKSYAAYYEPVEDINWYKPIYHARGWVGKYTAPQFGSNTTTNGLPVVNDVMEYGKFSEITNEWAILTQIPTINSSFGYGEPISGQVYTSGGSFYTTDGNPDMNYFWSPNSLYPCEYRGVSNKWCVKNSFLFPRSTWLVLESSYTFQTPYDVSSMFDVSGLNMPNVNSVYDLIGPSSVLSNKYVWFELELHNLEFNTSVSGSDYFVTYFSDEVTISDNKITKLNNRYITDADPEYIAYYNSDAIKKVYRKVVNERTFFKRTLDGTTIGSDTEQILSGNFSSTNFNYQDGDCGVFNGWYTLEGGEREYVGNGNPSITVSRPNSCCNRYYPDVTSCSDKYYPYGFYGTVGGNTVYYRYALLPYVNTTNGSYISPSGSGVSVFNIDYTNIIINGLGEQGEDNYYFKLGPNETLYNNGLILLEFVNSTGSNVGNYKVVDGQRKLQKLTSSENVKTYKEVNSITNSTNSNHYYRIGWIEVDTSLLDENTLNYINSYDDYTMAINSGELFLVNDTSSDFTYNGMYYKDGIVYKNSCTINKSAIVLTCPSSSDFSQKMSMEEKYVDDGIAVETGSTTKFKKKYQTISSSDYGYGKNAIKYATGNTSQMGTKLSNNFGITSGGSVHVPGDRGGNEKTPCNTFKYYGENYEINNFDGGRFGFKCVDRVGVGPYLGTRLYYDENLHAITQGALPNNTMSGGYLNYNPSDTSVEENARSVNMVAGKFICDITEDKMVLLDNNNLSDYINDGGYISNNQPCWYSLYDGGIAYSGSDNTVVRLAKDNSTVYGVGHFMFGTDSSYTDTFGRWWPLTNSNVIDLCDNGAGKTYHLVKNGSNYTLKRSYILLSDGENGGLQAFYFSSTDGWVAYDALPVLLDLSALDGDDEVWILRNIGENYSREYSKTYILDTDSGNNDSYYIRPLNTQWPFQDDEFASDQMLVVQKFVGKELTGSKKYQLQFNKNNYTWIYNGSSWYYGDIYKVSDATDINNALKDEVRFIEPTTSFTYDGVSYSQNTVYKLNIVSSAGNVPTTELMSSGEIEYALDNGVTSVSLVYESGGIEELTEFYCTSDGFDKHGFYIGIPGCGDDNNQYYGYKNTLMGYTNNDVGGGISQNLYNKINTADLTCVSQTTGSTETVGTIYQPSVEYNDDSAFYQRNIDYNGEYNYYQITKYGYYVNNEFIEVPSHGYKILRMADGGAKRKLLNYLIDNITSTKETSNGYTFYNLSAPLQTSGSTLLQKSYDYVPYNGTPSTSTNVATVTQFLTARDTNHTQFIHTTSDIYVHYYNHDDGACIRYPGDRYYQLSSNYYKTITPSDYGMSDSGNIDLEFLGWVVESAPVYEFYCDSVGNANGSVVEYPIKDEYSIDNDGVIDSLELGDYIYQNEIVSTYANSDATFIETSTPLNDYSIAENETTLRACLNSSTPFKVESYDGNDIYIDYDGGTVTYQNGYYYSPTSEVLTSAFKYHYPYLYINAGTSLEYNETHFIDEQYYINSGVYSVIYTDNDVNRVLSYGLDFITIADYRKSSSSLSGAVNVSNIDDLKKCISNKTQKIHITSNVNIDYKFMTYMSNGYYTRNSVSINGRTFFGGDVLIKTVESNFISKEQNVKILGCETATAVYANSFLVEFCSITGDYCINTDNTLNSAYNGLVTMYDGAPVTWVRDSVSPTGSENFKIDHRHFIGKHNLEFMRLDSYTTDSGTYVETEDFTYGDSCIRLVGYRVGTCMKTFTGDPIKTKPGAINDIRTFVYGILPACGKTLAPASSCDAKIITNNAPALFGQSSTGSQNVSYPYYNYMFYDTNTQYYWDNNDACYKRYQNGQTIPSSVNTSSIYKTTICWEDGAITLNNKVSNGLYRVTVKEYDGDTTLIDSKDLIDISSWDEIYTFGDYGALNSLIRGFAKYFKTGNYVDGMNSGLEMDGFKLRVKPQTVYRIDYLKTCSLEFTLTKDSDTLELLLCVYDIVTGPVNFLGRGEYQILNAGHWNGPTNQIYDIRTTEELEDAIFNARPVIRIISTTALTANGQTFEPYGHDSGSSIVVDNGNMIYGNIRYNDGFCNSTTFGYCKNPILKYISVVAAQLNAPNIIHDGSGHITMTNNNTASGVRIYYTTNGSTPTTSSTLYSGQFSFTGTVTFKAICVANGYTNSSVTTQQYTYEPPQQLTEPVVTEVYNG